VKYRNGDFLYDVYQTGPIITFHWLPSGCWRRSRDRAPSHLIALGHAVRITSAREI
jgi:hypothetical protein